MADANFVNGLRANCQQLLTLSLDALYRKNLGEESFEGSIRPIYERILSKAEFMSKYAEFVSNDAAANSINILNNIFSQLQNQANTNNQSYIANKATCLANVNAQINQLAAWWPDYIAAAVDQTGILNDGGLETEHKQALEALRNESTTSLNNIKTEAGRIIDEARQLAREIETGARKTAAHISVADAQTQFKNARFALAIQICIWAVLSGLLVTGLAALIYKFSIENLPPTWSWQVGYIAAIHFAALTAAASLLAYCLSILRAQLHMFNHNSHRIRITNSMEAFIRSAITPEQRDFILARLVEEIANFGNSGLVEGDKADGPKIVFDPISKLTKSDG